MLQRNHLLGLLLAGSLAVASCGNSTGSTAAEDATIGTDATLSDTAGSDATATDAAADIAAGTDALADVQDVAINDVPPADTPQTDIAADAGQDVAPDIAPDDITPGSCGGKTNIACGVGQYCATPDGQCGGIGTCQAKPQACDLMYAPVCGCDGKDYGNACAAAIDGVNVAKTGVCNAVDNTCGGKMGKPCGKSQFCDPSGCGADMTGLCVDIPSGCPKNLMPVCGCDGKTYGNDCMRVVAQTGKASDGQCPVLTECTVGDNTTCGPGQYCKAPFAGTCDGKGSCETVPQICPMIFMPVCGCDAKDYGNDCEAAANAVNVAASGECGPPNCTTTKDCPNNLACKSGVCGSCPGIMCTAIACPQGQVKDQCCTCYTP